MENEKNATKSLYAKGPLFFNIGLIIALTLCFIAFEFKVYIAESESVDIPETPVLMAMGDIKSTVQPPKVKPFIPPKKNTEINIVDKKEETDTKKKTEEPPVDINQITDFIDGDGPGDEILEDNNIYIGAGLEVGPSFNGGIDAFYKYIGNEISYPKQEQRMNIEGRVIVSFVIEKDGSLSDIQILKGVSSGLDEEAIRVLKAAPKWSPGRQRGQEVRVRMNIPIFFKLN